jgi:hypothetical protein
MRSRGQQELEAHPGQVNGNAEPSQIGEIKLEEGEDQARNQ